MRLMSLIVITVMLSMGCATQRYGLNAYGEPMSKQSSITVYDESKEKWVRIDTSEPPPAPVKPSPGSLAYLDFKNGFRDLKFSDLPTSDMQLVEERDDTRYYTRPGDNYTIGNATVKGISYGFYKERLYSVLLQTKDLSNSQALLEVLRL